MFFSKELRALDPKLAAKRKRQARMMAIGPHQGERERMRRAAQRLALKEKQEKAGQVTL